MTRLAIFDIDGTLTDTSAVDDECFRRAVADVLQLDTGPLDWRGAPHMTDSSIARWVCESRHGRVPHDAEMEQIVERFLELLGEQLASAPSRFMPIRGAADALCALRRAGWDLALATGGWEPSARLKLAAAGIEGADVALACASDAFTREEIVQIARGRAEERSGHVYTRIVSVGAGVWDVSCARALGLPFIGIGVGGRADELRRAGATTVLSDLTDTAALCTAMDSATTPGQPRSGSR